MATTTPGRSRIFISYRHEDTDVAAGRLADDLRKHFTREQVFQDFASIEPGTDFTVAVQHGLDACAAVLVIIGPKWLTTADRQGRRRLDLPDDWVAHEVAESLRRPEVRVFPVLVDADMPSVEELPEPLRPLTRRQAFPLTSRHWPNDVADLIAFLKKVPGLGGAAPPAAGTSESPSAVRAPEPAPQAAPPRRPPSKRHAQPRGPEQETSGQAVSAPTTTAESTAVVPPLRIEGEERGIAEAAAQRQAEQAEQRRLAEAAAQRRAEEAEQRQLAEAEAQRQAEQAEQRRLAEAEAQRQAEEADQRRLAEVEAQRQAEQAEQAEQRRLAWVEAQRRAEIFFFFFFPPPPPPPPHTQKNPPFFFESPRTRTRGTASGQVNNPGPTAGFEALLRRYERDPNARVAAVEVFVQRKATRASGRRPGSCPTTRCWASSRSRRGRSRWAATERRTGGR